MASGSQHLARALLSPLGWLQGRVQVMLLPRGQAAFLPATSPSSTTGSNVPKAGR